MSHRTEKKRYRKLLVKIYEKLEHDDIFGWDDGDPCWDELREVYREAYLLDQKVAE